MENKNQEQTALIAKTAEKGADLQSQNLSLIVDLRKAKETRDRAKEAYDSLEPGPQKDEAKALYEQMSAKVDGIEQNIQDLQEKARAEKVTITQYQEPTQVEKFPEIIKRITLATGLGTP